MEASELKKELGNKAKEIILRGYSLVEKNKKVSCPFHEDKNPSMEWYDKGNMFNCFSCGEKIDIYRYYTEKEGLSFPQAIDKVKDYLGIVDMLKTPAKKSYQLPNVQMNELSGASIEYMKQRKITKETLDAWNVKECLRNNEPYYVFSYKFKENKNIEYVTFRYCGKPRNSRDKGGCLPNTKSMLWGMWHIEKDKPIVITEGQPDAMSVYQSGYKNVVSIPAGANNFTWISNCWDWLKECKEFIFWADNDEAGDKCAQELKKRLDNLKIVKHYKYKDANELLFYESENSVYELIQNAINEKPDGLLELSEVNFSNNYQEYIETGFYDYDRHVEDWKTSELTVIFGRNGEGKTTFIAQVIAHNLQKKVKTFLYNGELSNFKIQDWIYRQVIGKDLESFKKVQGKYGDKYEIKDDIIKKIKAWHKDSLYLFDNTADKILQNMDKFFEVMEITAKKYGVKLFIIDNLMSILFEDAKSLLSDQANFVQRCKNFATNLNVHVVIIAHPNKMKKEVLEAKGNLTKSDISGTNNIPNKADNIISIERNWSKDELKFCDMILTSHKDRNTGERNSFNYNFSKKTLRFYNESTLESYNYSWKYQGREGEQCEFDF